MGRGPEGSRRPRSRPGRGGAEPTVLVISQLPPPVHGSTVMTQVFLDTLRSLRFRVVLTDRRFSRRLEDIGALSPRKVVAAVSLALRMLRNIRRERPSVCVFFITNRPGSFVVDWALSELLRLARLRTIAYVHTLGYESLAGRNRVFAWLTRRLLTTSALTVCLGSRLTRDVERWVDPSTIVVIPNTPLQEGGSVPDDERRRVLFLANLLPEKGPEAFVELTLTLAPEFPERVFTMAGATSDAGYSKRLEERLQASGLDNVEFLGAASTEQKWQLLRQSAVLVFPSTYRYEAQPLTIIEALSVGTPTIAFDVGGIGDIIRSGENGYMVAPGDLNALTVQVRRYLSDAAGRLDMSRRGEQDFVDRFSRAQYRAVWSSALARVIES